MYFYTGAYTEPGMGHAQGIGRAEFDPENGALSAAELLVAAPNPSFLTISPDGARLYAVDERDIGAVRAYLRDPASGALQLINSQPTGGAHPCYLSLDPTARFVLASNYTGGSVAVIPIAEDGSLEPVSQVLAHEGSSIDPQRQTEPHPHMVLPSPDGRFISVTDLGTDQVVCYRLDAESGTLLDVAYSDVNPGMGPRHFAFSRDGRSMVVIGELDSSLNSFAIEDDGSLTPFSRVSTLPADFTSASTCAHVLFSPDGRFVYGSNRGHDSIAVASFDDDSRELQLVQIIPTGGKEPRNFTLDPTGNWLLVANQLSDTITVHVRDAETGRLTATGNAIASLTPVCLLFAGEK